MDSESDNAHRISTTGYELKLDTFSGPLDKLLELIEAKELEITRLNLAEVTADFLSYVRSLGEIDPRILTDFITVAASLILIKSHAILPQLELSQEEEGDIADLENRLRLYREFRVAENYVRDRWQENSSHARDYLLQLPGGFYLTDKIFPSDLHSHMERIYNELQSFIPKVQEESVKLISLEEKIEEIIKRVDKVVRTSFNDMTEGKVRSEIVALFLALLHLIKDSAVNIQQDGLFSDIQITKIGGR